MAGIIPQLNGVLISGCVSSSKTAKRAAGDSVGVTGASQGGPPTARRPRCFSLQ